MSQEGSLTHPTKSGVLVLIGRPEFGGWVGRLDTKELDFEHFNHFRISALCWSLFGV